MQCASLWLLLLLSGCGVATSSVAATPSEPSAAPSSSCRLSSATSLAALPANKDGRSEWWAPSVTSLAVDSAHVYYTIDGGAYSKQTAAGPGSLAGVWRVDKCGGAPVELARLTSQSSFQSSVAVDASYVYWSDGSVLHRMAKSGGPDEVFASDPSRTLATVLLDEDNVYWTAFGKATYELFGRPKAGGAITTLVSSLSEPTPWTSATGVYAWSGTAPTLYRLTLAGTPAAVATTPALVTSCEAEYPRDASMLRLWCENGFELAPPARAAAAAAVSPSVPGFASSRGRLYYVENGSSGDTYCPLSARMVSLDLASGHGTTLASWSTKLVPCGSLSPVVLDEQNVYFATETGIVGVTQP